MSIRNPTHSSAAVGDTDLSPHTVARVCKALGHPVRMQIIAYLKLSGRCFCGELVSRLPLAQSTVSQHLKCLKDAGVIVGAIEGSGTCYRLDRAMLARFQRSLAHLLEEENNPQDRG